MAESASIPVLHSYWRSSAAYRVRIALALKGQPYRSVTWQMAQGEHLQPAYRRLAPFGLAPFGLVPMLDIDGLRLRSRWPSSSTWRNATPNPRCCRQAARARGRARALAQLIACEVHPLNNLRALKRLRTQFGADDEQVGEWYRHWCHEAFSAFEAALGDDDGSPYALGDAPGIVECFLMPQVYNARRYGADLAPYGRIDAIARACAALPAFQAASPEHQPDAPQPAPAANPA